MENTKINHSKEKVADLVLFGSQREREAPQDSLSLRAPN